MKTGLKKALHEPYIIKASGNVSVWIRLRDALLTVFLWALYIYLLHDFFIFLGDIYHWLHDGYGTAKAYPKLRIFETLENYGRGLLTMAVIFIGWALYNRLRYGHLKRRKTTEPVTVEDLGKMYHLEPRDLKVWQKSRLLTVHTDAKGRVAQVDDSAT